jgi:hypothetical protein
VLQAHEHDLASTIDECIREAKEMRAKHIAEASKPTLKAVGSFALVAVMVPWHAVRNTLTTLGS